MELTVGMEAPDFELEASNGQKVKLSEYRGKEVVLYFYPKDMTPGCTTQACDFRDSNEDFSHADAVIIGISTDPIARHIKFVDKYSLPFILLSDEEHKVADLYQVWKLKKNYGKEYMGIERSTFAIDKEGKITKVWRNVKVKGHVEKVLQQIRDNPGK